MRDGENSIGIGGDSSGPIIQARNVVYARWTVALSLVAIVALTVVGVVALQQRDTAGAPAPASATGEPDTATSGTSTTPEPTTLEPTTPEPTSADRTTTEARTPSPGRTAAYVQRYSAERVLTATDIDRDEPQRATNGDEDFWVDYLPPVGSGPTHAVLYGGPRFRPVAAVAEWEEDAAPEATGCVDLVRRRGTVSVRMSESGVYCVVGADHVAMIDGLDLDGRDPVGLLTVWSRG